MVYFLLILLPIIAAFLKVPQKKFQNDTLGIDSSVNIYLFLNCILGMIFFASLAGWNVIPNIPTLVFSLIFAGNSIFSNIVNLLAIRKVNIANMAVFSGAGSIILPIFFGILFLKESVPLFKWLAVILLLIVIILPLFNKIGYKKTNLPGYIYCLLLFIDAGISTIVCKLYGLTPGVLNDNIFCFWTNVFIFPFAIILSLKSGGPGLLLSDMKEIKPKTYFFGISSIVLGFSATLLSIRILKTVNIAAYTIINSSLSLIFTAFFSRVCFKEKITPQIVLSITLSVAAIILNIL